MSKKAKPTAKRAKHAKDRVSERSVPAAKSTAATTVKIAAAKGRPMLTWVGKRPLGQLPAFPAQLVEKFEAAPAPDGTLWTDWPAKYPKGGLLFHGDNKEVLAHLLANGFRGKVQLIYIDPPFDSGADYVRKVSLRGPSGLTKIDGEEYTLGEQVQYTDIWANDNYLQFMYERLCILAELLAADGSMYLHCDQRRNYLLRCLLDEVLGADAFVSEIVWQSADAQSSAKRYGPIHNTILYYARGDRRIWNDVRTTLSKATADTWYTNEESLDRDLVNRRGQLLKVGTGRRFNKADLTARKPGGDTQYEWKGVRPPIGRYWAYSREKMEEFDRYGLLVYSESGRPYLKRYLDEVVGTPPQDLWTDISMLRGISSQRDWDYPTEKPEPLIERLIRISSEEDALVLDCFIGSGTTAAVAQRLGRRWIGCDINKGAIQTTVKRVQGLMKEQVADASTERQGSLIAEGDEAAAYTTPAQLGFSVWRVNDYDLQVQHNEAVNLRRDARHGGWLSHTPAQADVSIKRKGKSVIVDIHDFISPSIVERLRQQAGILNPKIEDCRAMIDSVAIDPAYDGKAFNDVVVDVPKRKTDYVQGTYELPAPAGKTTVAVRITDMLGEEILVTKTV